MIKKERNKNEGINMVRTQIFRCNNCGNPCILISEDPVNMPRTCPYSKITISSCNFIEQKGT